MEEVEQAEETAQPGSGDQPTETVEEQISEAVPSEAFGDDPVVDVVAIEEVAAQEVAAEEIAAQEIAAQEVGVDDVVIAEAVTAPAPSTDPLAALKAVIEAAIYITDEPLIVEQIATAVEQPVEQVKEILDQLVAEYASPDRGLSIREIAGGYKMSTKPEHHESIRRFVRNLQPPLKLSLAALETLAVIAYKQPITGPEIMDIRGVQGAGVLKTLLDRKLIAAAGRKNVLGKPMLYKTTREFLVQFGLNSLSELPTLKEFEELGRLSLTDEPEAAPPDAPAEPQREAELVAPATESEPETPTRPEPEPQNTDA
ncbi:MAG: SMC-Scp complex subunit ScpB [Acidobacteriaceae bacterium]|nr:SMC-Scp complex subunit ScpB [Acidobacteriaceae bacterium]